MILKRKYLPILSMALILGGGTQAYAKLEAIISCSEIVLKEANLDTVCTSSKDGQFKRVNINGNLAIQDLGVDGKIWFDFIAKGVNQPQAVEMCKSRLDQFLPTKEDFELAESRGLREAFRDMRSRIFWTFSIHPFSNYFDAYFFNGSYGSIDYVNRHNTYVSDSARCVYSVSKED